MLKSVMITNHLGESTTIELRFPEKSGFLVRGGIEGLGPSKANINTTQVVVGDGATFNSARVEPRNIVFKLAFLESATIEETRQRSYKFFPIKRKIKLTFETDRRICYTYGYVESNEPVIFSEAEGTSISVICPDPYFYSMDNHLTLFSTAEPNFEFPFSNESLDTKEIKFGDILYNDERTIYYPGDASVGITMRIHSVGSASGLRITNTRTLEYMTIDSPKLLALTGSDIVAGDDIVISTKRGEKYVRLERGGDAFNIRNALSKDVDWFQLEKGNNIFAYTASLGIEYLSFRIENQIAYEGL
jgi:hypothetical protein